MTIVPISSFCKTGSGTTPSRSDEARYYGGTIPWVKSGELREAEIFDTEEKVTEAALAETSLKLVPANSLLLAMYGATVGRVGFLRTEATTNQAVCHIIPDPARADVGYMFHVLQWMAPQFVSRGVGGAQPNISQKIVQEALIRLPPLDEQRRIAAILDQADALRRRGIEAEYHCSKLIQAIFLRMFGDWSKPDHNIPLTAIGPHLDFLTSGSRGWASYYRDMGDLFLRIQNVRYDQLDLRDVSYVQPPQTAEAVRTKVKPGDVLLSITADLGRTAVVPEGIGDAFINQHLSILRTDAFEPRFLSAALASAAGQRTIQSKNREGVKAGLNFDDIKSLEIPAADRGLQVEFTRKATAVDQLLSKYRLESAKISDLFRSLQTRLIAVSA